MADAEKPPRHPASARRHHSGKKKSRHKRQRSKTSSLQFILEATTDKKMLEKITRETRPQLTDYSLDGIDIFPDKVKTVDIQTSEVEVSEPEPAEPEPAPAPSPEGGSSDTGRGEEEEGNEGNAAALAQSHQHPQILFQHLADTDQFRVSLHVAQELVAKALGNRQFDTPTYFTERTMGWGADEPVDDFGGAKDQALRRTAAYSDKALREDFLCSALAVCREGSLVGAAFQTPGAEFLPAQFAVWDAAEERAAKHMFWTSSSVRTLDLSYAPTVATGLASGEIAFWDLREPGFLPSFVTPKMDRYLLDNAAKSKNALLLDAPPVVALSAHDTRFLTCVYASGIVAEWDIAALKKPHCMSVSTDDFHRSIACAAFRPSAAPDAAPDAALDARAPDTRAPSAHAPDLFACGLSSGQLYTGCLPPGTKTPWQRRRQPFFHTPVVTMDFVGSSTLLAASLAGRVEAFDLTGLGVEDDPLTAPRTSQRLGSSLNVLRSSPDKEYVATCTGDACVSVFRKKDFLVRRVSEPMRPFVRYRGADARSRALAWVGSNACVVAGAGAAVARLEFTPDSASRE